MTRSKDHRGERVDKQSRQQARPDTTQITVPPQPTYSHSFLRDRALEIEQGHEIPLEHADRPEHYGEPGGERDRVHASYKNDQRNFLEEMQRLKEIDEVG